MTSPPCRTVEDVTDVFTGFSNLPDVTSWDAVMTFQQNYIDVYSGEATPTSRCACLQGKREKGRDFTDKSKKQRDNTKTPPKLRLHNDYGPT